MGGNKRMTSFSYEKDVIRKGFQAHKKEAVLTQAVGLAPVRPVGL